MQIGIRLHDTLPLSLEERLHTIQKQGFTCAHVALSKTIQEFPVDNGALSKVRKLINKEVNLPDQYISIQEWFECPYPMSYFIAIFDKEISDFYSWIIPKENYVLLGAALRPKENTWDKYNMLKTKLINYGFCFDRKLKTEGAFINRPKKISQFYIGKDAIALVGEASGAISPSSAEGISYALKSSLYLAESLEEGIEGFMDRYKNKVYDIKLNLFLKNLKSPVMYHPFLRKLAMKSGLQSIK